MKKQLTLALAALTTVIVLPACTSVHEHEEAAPRTHTATTTTSESVVRRPVSSTAVESTTVRSY